MDCPDISKYTANFFLKVTMSCQLLCGLFSILGILFTHRKIFSSILLDSAFKEYLICCYAIHLVQSLGVFLLQALLFFQYIVQPTCLATIPSWLCYSLRFSMIISVISLPILNVTLTIIRFLSFFGGSTSKKRERITRRVFFSAAIVIFCLELYWRLNGVIIPSGQVPYCIGNLKSFAEKSNIEAAIIGSLEIGTILGGLLLMHLYQRENRLRKSYDISVNLIRRQLILSMQLFLPYSFVHAISFLSLSVLGYAYREFFLYLEEPWYSAGSGFTFFPMYFTVVSPWIIYWIVVKNDKKRINKTAALIDLEQRAKTIYFENYRSQWEYQGLTKGKQKARRFPFLKCARRSPRIDLRNDDL